MKAINPSRVFIMVKCLKVLHDSAMKPLNDFRQKYISIWKANAIDGNKSQASHFCEMRVRAKFYLGLTMEIKILAKIYNLPPWKSYR